MHVAEGIQHRALLACSRHAFLHDGIPHMLALTNVCTKFTKPSPSMRAIGLRRGHNIKPVWYYRGNKGLTFDLIISRYKPRQSLHYFKVSLASSLQLGDAPSRVTIYI